MSSSDNIKKISIQNAAGSYDTRDVAMEAQNTDVSFTGGGQVIEDITEPGVVIGSVKSLAKTIKDINTDLSNKANVSDLSGKADLDSETGLVDTDQLPDDIDDIIEGYYKESDGKFYKNYNPSTQTYSDEITGQTGKIYVDKLTNGMFRWAGSPLNQFVKIVNLGDMDLDDISNVDISTVQDGESLVYDSVRGKWVNKMQTAHFIPIPTITVGTYTYNGSPHGPTVTGKSADFDTYVTTTGATAVDAGSYTLRFSLKNTGVDMWSDLTTGDKTYDYTINKANGSVVLASNAVTLDDDHKVVSVNVTSTTGTVSASSSATGIVTVTATDSAVTITATEETGTATITVTAAASTNYKSATASIAVTANFKVLVSWSTGTDEEITKMVNDYYSGKTSLSEIQGVWHVGDSRSINLSAMSATGVDESHRAQTVTMVILDFDHDILVNSSGGKTKALVTLGQKDCLRDATVTDEQGSSNTEKGYINSTNDNRTGWNTCARRTWCNSVYYNALPSYLKSLVRQVKKSTAATGGTSSPTWYVNHDYCFLPSEWEVIGAKNRSAETGQNATHIDKDASDASVTMPTGGTQYSYYTTASNRYKLPKWNSSSVSSYWWERSPATSNETIYCNVAHNGNTGYSGVSEARGIAPSCCI